MPSSGKRIKKQHPLSWVVEPLIEDPSYLEKPIFGCQAYYLHGRLALVLASGKEPWDGLLIPTEKQFHDSIKKDFNGVIQHPVLKKWLYVWSDGRFWNSSFWYCWGSEDEWPEVWGRTEGKGFSEKEVGFLKSNEMSLRERQKNSPYSRHKICSTITSAPLKFETKSFLR